MKGYPHRDWFGLASFRPGVAFQRGRLYLLESVGSTSDFLLGRGEPAVGRICRWRGWGWQAEPLRSLRPHPAPAGAVAVARRQTGGRGRQGRDWIDLGGLQMSWVFEPGRSALTAGLPVWTGLVVAMVLSEHFGLAVDLKWPNDLLVEGRKLGGVLLDRIGSGDQSPVIGGLGLNLNTGKADFPSTLHGRAISMLLAIRRTPRLGVLAGTILSHLDTELPIFQAEGWSAYNAGLQQCDYLRGKRVSLESAGVPIRGQALGIDQDGALLVQPEVGDAIRVLAGEVHVLDIENSRQEERQE